MSDFEAFPKIPRLRRDVVITEKIDGTNACVVITEEGEVYAQSRKRVITPTDDNFGFAAWVAEHNGPLHAHLGPGRHFGEWWGSGIQRGYGMNHKRFSLFNTSRWADLGPTDWGLDVVPVLASGVMSDRLVNDALDKLTFLGSQAARFPNPEGIIIYHAASNGLFKVTLENDAAPKGVAA